MGRNAKKLDTSYNQQVFSSSYQGKEFQYLYYMKALSYPDSQPLLVLVIVPSSALLGDTENPDQGFFVLENNNVVAYDSIDEQSQHSIDTILQQISVQNSPKTSKGYQQYSFSSEEFFLLNVQHMPLKFVYAYPYSSFDKCVLAATCIVFLLSAAGTLLVAVILSRKLYHPIRKIMSHIPLSHNDNELIDEFAVIEQNASTMSLLNEQLENAIVEKNNLVALRYYRELLFTIPDWNCPLTADQMAAKYCVALVEFTDPNNQFSEDDWYLQLQKNYLYVHVQSLRTAQTAYCISTTSNCCAVLIQTDDIDLAKELVENFFSISSITCQLRIALSDIQE